MSEDVIDSMVRMIHGMAPSTVARVRDAVNALAADAVQLVGEQVHGAERFAGEEDGVQRVIVGFPLVIGIASLLVRTARWYGCPPEKLFEVVGQELERSGGPAAVIEYRGETYATPHRPPAGQREPRGRR